MPREQTGPAVAALHTTGALMPLRFQDTLLSNDAMPFLNQRKGRAIQLSLCLGFSALIGLFMVSLSPQNVLSDDPKLQLCAAFFFLLFLSLWGYWA